MEVSLAMVVVSMLPVTSEALLMSERSRLSQGKPAQVFSVVLVVWVLTGRDTKTAKQMFSIGCVIVIAGSVASGSALYYLRGLEMARGGLGANPLA